MARWLIIRKSDRFLRTRKVRGTRVRDKSPNVYRAVKVALASDILHHKVVGPRVCTYTSICTAAAALGNNSATPLLARYHKFELPHTVHINNSLRKARRDTTASLIFARDHFLFLSNETTSFFFFQFL